LASLISAPVVRGFELLRRQKLWRPLRIGSALAAFVQVNVDGLDFVDQLGGSYESRLVSRELRRY
jgi:hypothetical protein